VSSITIISDAPRHGITNGRHADNSRGVFYYCNMFMVQAYAFSDDEETNRSAPRGLDSSLDDTSPPSKLLGVDDLK